MPMVLRLVSATRIRLCLLIAGAVLTPSPAWGRAHELPLGPPGLKERSSKVTVAPGVKLTRIVRGGSVRGLRYGPWRIRVLTINRVALHGHLGAVLSNDRIAGRETVS